MASSILSISVSSGVEILVNKPKLPLHVYKNSNNSVYKNSNLAKEEKF